MGERTGHAPGTFSWADLTTTDLEGAKRFYTELFGWEFEDMPAGEGMVYSMARLRGRYAAAASEGDPAQGPPRWTSYVTVGSADEAADRATAAGGTAVMAPFDVLDVGRMAIITDPTGAFLALWEPRRHIGAEVVNEPGALTWNELGTDDPEAAKAFFADVFGWTYEESPDPSYSMIKNGDRMNGGIRRKRDDEAGFPNFWTACFGSADVEETASRTEAAGGQVHAPPFDAGPGRYAVLADPQGAIFTVYSGPFQG